ncbi:NAD(P)-binding domain-containing protein [Streptomyces mirabilis]|uniref:NAD(P)-binding domain-containing protein n=1 Tax=Streptomyces mirabilis TaxID=68239 RepID=UPI00367EC77C
MRRLGLDVVILDAQTSSPRTRLLAARPPHADAARPDLPRRAARVGVPRRLREAVRAARRAPGPRPRSHRDGGLLRGETDSGTRHARAVISATGTWWRPFVRPGRPRPAAFGGNQLHTVEYRSPADFAGQRVVVVGGGNSGAQIAAEANPMFTRPVPDRVEWADGTRAETDTIIWCTGFRPALLHLAPLGLRGPRPYRHHGDGPCTSHACTCSATATGPALSPPASSASAVRHVTPHTRSRTWWAP